MSDHSTALVPIESWCYASPDRRAAGASIDIGLFAEALIYYDRVLVNVGNQPQFAEFLAWFESQDSLADLFALFRDGTLGVYDYAFVVSAIEKNGVYSIWNLQDPVQAEPNTFEQRVLYHPSVEQVLARARHRKQLYKALRGRVTEVKAAEFGSPIANARLDYADPRRNALVVQAYVDELYRFRRLGRPPDVQASVASSHGGQHRVTWNINFEELSEQSGPQLGFHTGMPLTAGAVSNRLLWSSAISACDLYLPRPIAVLVGDKLFESAETIAKTGAVIQDLKHRVEFPDVRSLVNQGDLKLADVLRIRKKARRFRDWLQSESDRDRDAIIAYHNEVAKELGITEGARMTLRIFGVLGGGAAGSAIGTAVGGPIGGAVGASAGSGTGYLADLAAKMGSNWRPLVFGEWLRKRIEKVVADK